MKKLLFPIFVLAMSLTMNAQNSEGITLTVVIENVLNSEGHVLSGLHNEDTFMKAEGIKTSKDKAEAGEASEAPPRDRLTAKLHEFKLRMIQAELHHYT